MQAWKFTNHQLILPNSPAPVDASGDHAQSIPLASAHLPYSPTPTVGYAIADHAAFTSLAP